MSQTFDLVIQDWQLVHTNLGTKKYGPRLCLIVDNEKVSSVYLEDILEALSNWERERKDNFGL